MSKVRKPLQREEAARVVEAISREMGLGESHMAAMVEQLAKDPKRPHRAIEGVIASHMAGCEGTPSAEVVATALRRKTRTPQERKAIAPVLRQMDKYGGAPVEAFMCCIEEGLAVGDLLDAMREAGVRNDRIEDGAQRLAAVEQDPEGG